MAPNYTHLLVFIASVYSLFTLSNLLVNFRMWQCSGYVSSTIRFTKDSNIHLASYLLSLYVLMKQAAMLEKFTWQEQWPLPNNLQGPELYQQPQELGNGCSPSQP